MEAVFLDTETTGVVPSKDRIVDIAIVDEHGQVLLNTLVNPGIPIPRRSSKVHGICDEDVLDAPSYEEIENRVKSLCDGKHVVAYNAAFDMKFLKGVKAAKVSCAMRVFCESYRIHHGTYKSHSLNAASEEVGYDWGDDVGHRALADAKACRYVWLHTPALWRSQH